MKYTPEQRRAKIYELLKKDPDFQKMLAEYEPAKSDFTKLTDRLPKRLRSRLWSYPGSAYFMHHRMLTLICEVMRFPEEE